MQTQSNHFMKTAERVDRMIFKATVLMALFGFSIGPIVHREMIAQVLGVCASLALTCLAGAYLFSVRRQGTGQITQSSGLGRSSE